MAGHEFSLDPEQIHVDDIALRGIRAHLRMAGNSDPPEPDTYPDLQNPMADHDIRFEEFLIEDSFSYPISFNGKMRLQLEFPIALSKEEVEAAVLANPEVQQRLEGKPPKKVIVVPKRIVNIVV